MLHLASDCALTTTADALVERPAKIGDFTLAELCASEDS